MDLIILNDGAYHLVAVTKQMIEGIELFVLPHPVYIVGPHYYTSTQI
jgi:hypothetical protein